MARFRVMNLGSLNLKVSPFLQKDGELTRCINVEKDVIGAYKKRPGYATFLGTANGSAVVDLFTWNKNDGTSVFVYRNSGGRLYYYDAGVGTAAVWTLCGGGTVTAGSQMGHAVLGDTLIVGQDGGTTQHSTNGVAFGSTTSAPAVPNFAQYHNRVWASGTSSHVYFCTAGTATDWTTDSSSFMAPGEGKVNALWATNDKLVVSKNSGQMYTYDEYNLRQIPTQQGLTSPKSLGETEDYKFFVNRLGFFGQSKGKPELISNAIEKQIYNDSGSAVAGTAFTDMPGHVHRYNYYCALGTTTDDLTGETINDCIIVYDYQLNEWRNYKFTNFPTAWTTYKDKTGVTRFIFGDASGQCFTFGGASVLDNATPITAELGGVLHFGAPEQDKYFRKIWAFANPGCVAKIQVAVADTFTKEKLDWKDLGNLKDGVVECGFPDQLRGKLLFWKVYERSKHSRFNFYGFAFSIDPLGK